MADGVAAAADESPSIPQPWDSQPLHVTGSSITEGGAVILFPGRDRVFYNRVQIFNRDLSVFVIRAYDQLRRTAATPREVEKAWHRHDLRQAAAAGAAGSVDGAAAPAGIASVNSRDPARQAMPGLRVLEALGATGLRSMRYAREIPGLDHVVCNDLDAAAVASIGANISFNAQHQPPSARPLAELVQPSHADAALLMYQNKEASRAYDVIDLDPYGSASPFLDAAVQAVVDGGLLAITCTDMAVLAGNNMDTCHAKYGTIPVRARHCHEQALRIVLAATEASANRYRRTIQPLLSVSIDFYVRVFVRVITSPGEVNAAPLRLSHLYQCAGCDSFWLVPKGRRGPGIALLQVGVNGAGAAESTSRNRRGGKRKRGAASAEAEAEAALGDAPEAAGTSAVPGALPVPGADADADTDAAPDADATPLAPAVPASGSRKRTRSADASAAPAPAASSVPNPQGKVHAALAPEIGSACSHCGRPVQLAGPIWSGPIHDAAFVSSLLSLMQGEFGASGRGVPGATTYPTRYYDVSRNSPPAEHDGGSNDVDTVVASRRRLMGVLRTIAEELPGRFCSRG
jgi:tRNA (guanine26-N2/guanine27-N2)-dimethyltransferase